MCETRFQQDFIQKQNKNRTFGCDKKMYPKLTFNDELINNELRM